MYPQRPRSLVGQLGKGLRWKVMARKILREFIDYDGWEFALGILQRGRIWVWRPSGYNWGRTSFQAMGTSGLIWRWRGLKRMLWWGWTTWSSVHQRRIARVQQETLIEDSESCTAIAICILMKVGPSSRWSSVFTQRTQCQEYQSHALRQWVKDVSCNTASPNLHIQQRNSMTRVKQGNSFTSQQTSQPRSMNAWSHTNDNDFLCHPEMGWFLSPA